MNSEDGVAHAEASMKRERRYFILNAMAARGYGLNYPLLCAKNCTAHSETTSDRVFAGERGIAKNHNIVGWARRSCVQ